MKGPDTDAQDQLPPSVHFRLATHGRSIHMGHLHRFCHVPRMSGYRLISDIVRALAGPDVSQWAAKGERDPNKLRIAGLLEEMDVLKT
jgi:hypothetical protein